MQRCRIAAVERRSRKYMAQVLTAFEEGIESQLPPSAQEAVQEFKAVVRSRFNDISTDAVDIFADDGDWVQNGVARDIRDQLRVSG
jgi:hypothetical protein